MKTKRKTKKKKTRRTPALPQFTQAQAIVTLAMHALSLAHAQEKRAPKSGGAK